MLITQGISSQGLLRYLNMNEKTLGQRIRERRKQVGLSQNGLSKAAGVSGSSISLWESDHTARAAKQFCTPRRGIAMFTNLDTVWRRGQNTSSPCFTR